jgi:hypothetical protein
MEEQGYGGFSTFAIPPHRSGQNYFRCVLPPLIPIGVNSCPFVVQPRAGWIGFQKLWRRERPGAAERRASVLACASPLALCPLNRSADSFVREFQIPGSRGQGCPRSAFRFLESFTDLKSRLITLNRRRSKRVLDCGGKRSATPLSPARSRPASWINSARPKAPSPLRSPKTRGVASAQGNDRRVLFSTPVSPSVSICVHPWLNALLRCRSFPCHFSQPPC